LGFENSYGSEVQQKRYIEDKKIKKFYSAFQLVEQYIPSVLTLSLFNGEIPLWEKQILMKRNLSKCIMCGVWQVEVWGRKFEALGGKKNAKVHAYKWEGQTRSTTTNGLPS